MEEVKFQQQLNSECRIELSLYWSKLGKCMTLLRFSKMTSLIEVADILSTRMPNYLSQPTTISQNWEEKRNSIAEKFKSKIISLSFLCKKWICKSQNASSKIISSSCTSFLVFLGFKMAYCIPLKVFYCFLVDSGLLRFQLVIICANLSFNLFVLFESMSSFAWR